MGGAKELEQSQRSKLRNSAARAAAVDGGVGAKSEEHQQCPRPAGAILAFLMASARVGIVGGGLGGLAVAHALSRAGANVKPLNEHSISCRLRAQASDFPRFYVFANRTRSRACSIFVELYGFLSFVRSLYIARIFSLRCILVVSSQTQSSPGKLV